RRRKSLVTLPAVTWRNTSKRGCVRGNRGVRQPRLEWTRYDATGGITTRFLHRIFRPCRRTRRPPREVTYEDCIDFCALPAGADLYGLWAEWISQLHPPAASRESTHDSVSCLRQRVAF